MELGKRLVVVGHVDLADRASAVVGALRPLDDEVVVAAARRMSSRCGDAELAQRRVREQELAVDAHLVEGRDTVAGVVRAERAEALDSPDVLSGSSARGTIGFGTGVGT